MVVVTPIKNENIQTICHGEQSGIAIVLKLSVGKKWNAKKSGRYITLSRKGCSAQLRLTEAAFSRYFAILKEEETT